MERVTAGAAPPSGPDEPATRACGDCLDNGYVSHQVTRRGLALSVSWFCDCRTGRAAEAGHWFDRVYRREGEKRSHSDRGQKELAEYLAAKPHQRLWLTGAIENLRQKFEAQRKRKLEAMEGAGG